MLNTLARLGDELKLYPVPERNFHLRRAGEYDVCDV